MAADHPAQAFLDLMVPYFGDQSREEGLRELVSVSSRHVGFHKEVLAAVDAACASAERGDAGILDAVRDRFLRDPNDIATAKAFLRAFRAEYVRLYDQETRQPEQT